MRLLLKSLLILLAAYGSANAQKKAVFIILDGIPADVIESVETPTLDEIAGKGGYSRAFTGGIAGGYSETPTISAVGYNSLLTGTWANKHNVWGNSIKDPNYNYWNIFRILKSGRPESKIAIFSTWLDNRTKLIGEGLEEAGNLNMDYAFDGFEHDTINFPHDKDAAYIRNIDEHVSKEAGRYILNEGPNLSWVYLEFTDDMGHRHGDSPQMVQAVKTADQQVKRIWEAIKTREKHYGEDWMILITTDHGRNAETGKNHGGQSERERTIWIVTNSDDLNQGFYDKPSMVDIMPSILTHMDIEIPEPIKKEMDGVSFVGEIKAKNLTANPTGGQLILQWVVYETTGKARIFISETDNFKEGEVDFYSELAEVSVSEGAAIVDIPHPRDSPSKILMQVDESYLNTWIEYQDD